jgi:hypothetical protein
MTKRSAVRIVIFVVTLSWAAPGRSFAQEACSAVAFPRTLDGPRLFPSSSDAGQLRFQSRLPEWICADTATQRAARFGLTPFALRGSYRSAYPGDRNNGAVWDGRGASFSLAGGVRFHSPHLQISFAPSVAFQENADFLTAVAARAEHPLAYPYLDPIDWPQRFGEAAFWTIDPGATRLSLSAGAAEVGVGTDNLWWGPARRYPLLFSNTGPGFPHADIGLGRPVWAWIGYARARLLWGRLDESAYFDARPEDDQRLLTGVFLELAPWFVPGLTLGLSGVQHNRWSDASRLFLDLFAFAFTTEEVSEGNGLLSITAEWSAPESGFAAYAEWARDDYWLNVEDVLTEPDHGQAYTLGFEKASDVNGLVVRTMFELTHLGMAATEQTGRSFSGVKFYTHFTIRQGHTHRGSLLGAWVGPGSDAQYLAVDVESRARSLGAFLERVRHDEDRYYHDFGDTYGFRGHDVEWTAGLKGLERAGALELQWQGGFTRRKNRSFIGLDRVSWAFLRETNLELAMTGWWLPGL